MAITAYAPNFTDNVSQITTSDFWRGGPFEYNSAIYLVGVFAAVGTVNSGVIQVVKSVNGGLTWTVCDAANQPSMAEVSGGHCVDCVRVGNTLYMLTLVVSSNAMQLTSFDLTTETFGAVVGGGPTVDTSGNGRDNPGIFQVSSNGVRKIIAYLPSASGLVTTKLVVYDGSWQAPVTVASDSRQIRSITIDASDRVHLITKKTNHAYEEYIFDSSNTLTGPFSMGFTASNSVGNTGPAVYDSGSDTIYVPILSVVAPGIGGRLLIGTPSSAPVWTQEVTGNSGNIVDWSFPVYVPSNGTSDPYFFAMEDGEVMVYTQKTSGVWSSRNQLFNAATDASVPTIFNAPTGIFRPFAAYLSTNTLVGVGGYPPDSVNPVAANTMYFITPSVPTPSGPGTGYVFEIEKGVGRLATFIE